MAVISLLAPLEASPAPRARKVERFIPVMASREDGPPAEPDVTLLRDWMRHSLDRVLLDGEEPDGPLPQLDLRPLSGDLGLEQDRVLEVQPLLEDPD